MASLEFRDPKIGLRARNACAPVENKQTNKQYIDILHFIGFPCKIN